MSACRILFCCTAMEADTSLGGDEDYSREELVAEPGSAFLCADLELHQDPREENAAYIATWPEVLKNDNPSTFAAAHTQRAADYLNKNARYRVEAPRKEITSSGDSLQRHSKDQFSEQFRGMVCFMARFSYGTMRPITTCSCVCRTQPLAFMRQNATGKTALVGALDQGTVTCTVPTFFVMPSELA
jgi:hypothetical protein